MTGEITLRGKCSPSAASKKVMRRSGPTSPPGAAGREPQKISPMVPDEVKGRASSRRAVEDVWKEL